MPSTTGQTVPTAQTDPLAYLAGRKFSSLLPKCPRTGLPVSYSDTGDPDGIPVLLLMPAGASRWLAAPQDPIAAVYGIRLIIVDRPGLGAIPLVPLKDRIRLACEMIVSVLEHLGIKLAHLIAGSAGIYYALTLLLHHPDIFLTGLDPPPNIYLVSPWSPPLPADHPGWYRSYLSYIPDALINTQHLTIPPLMKLSKTASGVWDTVSAAPSTFSKWWSTSGTADAPVLQPDTEREKGKEHQDIGYWGSFGDQCCLSCTVMSYFHAEDIRGAGQGEYHLLCLNREGANTGPEWFETTIAAVAKQVRAAQSRDEPVDLPVNLWWGMKDAMVPAGGREWLNHALDQEGIDLRVHWVEEGDHNNLWGRRDGLYEALDMIADKGHSTAPSTVAT